MHLIIYKIMNICSEHNKVNCGCQTYLTTPPPCPTPEDCPDAQPCSAVYDSQCIRYTGDPILCGLDIVIETDFTVEASLQAIINYFCTQVAALPSTVVDAGDGITVTSNTVGTVTTYTVSSNLRKFAKEFLSVLDGDIVTILATELQACGMLSDSCGVDGSEPTDFTYAVYYLAGTEWISLSQEDLVKVRVNATTGDISVVLDAAPVDQTRVRVVIIG
jgi:hypothetical protein